MSKFTPGGWHRGTGNGEGSIFADEGRMKLEEGGTTLYPICKMVKGWSPEEDEANEIAVAALPALVDAITFTLETLNEITTEDFARGGDKAIRAKLEAALKKAGLEV
jgi:hypothetical protein